MKKWSFPTAHTILLLIAGVVAISTWFIPAGQFDKLSYNADQDVFMYNTIGESQTLPATQQTLDSLHVTTQLEKFTSGDIWKPVGVPGTYHEIPANKQGIVDFILSPLKGIMQAIDVILFVLIIGGFIGIVNYSGVFDAGVAWLAKKLKGRESLLIVIITSLIALGGTTFGLAEETIAFYPILVPVFLAARYDAMVALASIYIGSSIGTMCSTVNPFSIIIASDAAGINWTSGTMFRIIVLVLGLIICIWYIVRYAERVRKDPSRSIIFDKKEEIESHFLHMNTSETFAFGWRERIILSLFGLSFVVMIYGVYSLDWWFLEMTAVFLVAAIIIGFVGKINEKKFVSEFVKGANDLLSVALIIGLARGVTVIMDEGLISDTLLYQASLSVEGMPKGLFVNVMMYIYAGLSFFISSSSGMAVLSMPIMAPLGDVVDVPREIIVNAYNWGMGLMAFITPTGLILPSLTMVNVGFNKWLKFVLPLLGIITVFTMIMLTISVMV